MKAWFLALRPKTLTAAVIPIIVGSGLAATTVSSLDSKLSWLALLSALFIQIATNLFNDALDFEKGADTDQRFGPARATQKGWLTAKQVKRVGLFFGFLALLCGIPLVIRGGEVIILIGVVSLFLAYAYTGGPLPLAYFGLGDVFVLIFFGLVAVGGVYYLQTLEYSAAALVAGVQVGCLATALIAINNLRDVDQDREVKKRTLAVLLGPTFVRYEILFLYLICFGLGGYWWMQGMQAAAIFPCVALPMAVRVIKGVFFHPPGALYNRFLALAALTQLLFGIFLTYGLMNPWRPL